MSESADFLTVQVHGGGTWTRLDRLTDGRVMCCLCFEHVSRDELNPVGEAGDVEDVCKSCALRECR